jgi:Erv1 / Alr family
MDTRFWGPSGWKLLHSIAFSASNNSRYQAFFETLPYILPCKFCRASLTDYYAELPIPEKTSLIPFWLYRIHNKVNKKLREQGLNPNPDPDYASIAEFYHKWLTTASASCKMSVFWDFLFAVAYNHPKETSRHSTPMPNCPEAAYTCKDKCTRNKWNTLDTQERLVWFRRFWERIPEVLPGDIASIWRNALNTSRPSTECRRSTVAWLWRMRCAMDPDFRDPYTQVCSKIASYASGCSSSRRAKTCRKK